MRFMRALGASESFKSLQRAAWIFASLAAVVGIGFGIYKAMRSPLFTVRIVEIADLADRAPVDAEKITALAAVPIGHANLFDLDLAAIERRLLAHPWIRSVNLRKRFPQALSISVEFRDARALIQVAKGQVAYVDATGTIFSRIDLKRAPDLPLLSAGADSRVITSLQLIDAWSKSPIAGQARLEALSYDTERGFRALAEYTSGGGPVATMIDLGHDFDDPPTALFERLERVFRYLGQNRMAVRQIWADSGKKIVVKMARGS